MFSTRAFSRKQPTEPDKSEGKIEKKPFLIHLQCRLVPSVFVPTVCRGSNGNSNRTLLAGWLAVAWLGGFEKGTLAAFCFTPATAKLFGYFSIYIPIDHFAFLPIGISKHFVSGRRKERTDAPSIVVVWGLGMQG